MLLNLKLRYDFILQNFIVPLEETTATSTAVGDVTEIIEDEGKEDNLDDKVTGSTTSATNAPEDKLTTKSSEDDTEQVISEGKPNK